MIPVKHVCARLSKLENLIIIINRTKKAISNANKPPTIICLKVAKDESSSLKNNNAVSFEKDDNSNGRVAFVNAASNLRTIAYISTPVDQTETRKVAGKIVPALASVVSKSHTSEEKEIAASNISWGEYMLYVNFFHEDDDTLLRYSSPMTLT